MTKTMKMKIMEKCLCGCEFLYYGLPNKDYERRYESWMKRHALCLTNAQKAQTDANTIHP